MTRKDTQSALLSTLRVLKSFICDVAMTVTGISSTGDITTTADMEAVNATLTGDLGAVNATLTGDLGAVNATLTGDLGAVNGTLTGDLGAVNATLTGDLGAVNATLTGDLGAVNGTLTGDLGAVNGTLTGDLGAVNATLTGDLGAVNGTLTGDLGAVNGTFSGDMTSATAEVTGVATMDTIRDDGYAAISGAAAGIDPVDTSRQVRCLTITISQDQVATIPQATPYEGIKLVDLPTDNLIVFGVVVDAEFTGSNLTVDSDLQVGIGSAEISQANWLQTDSDNLIEPVLPSSGYVKIASGTNGGLSSILLPAGAKAFYINLYSNPAPSGGGTATLKTGSVIKIFYINLDDHS